MASQFLLNLFITLLWVLLKDEGSLHVQTIVAGFIVGAIIIFFVRRFFGGTFYLHRVVALIKLLFLFMSDTYKSSIVVIQHIVTPKINLEPRIFSYKPRREPEWQATQLPFF